MNIYLKRLLLVITGALTFNIVFWDEKLALNAVLFDAVLLPSLLMLYPEAIKKRNVQVLLLGHLISLVAILYQNTDLSKITYFFTLFLLTAFVQYNHRSAWYAAGSYLFNFVFLPFSLYLDFRTILEGRKKKPMKSRLLRIMKLSVIPIALLIIFIMFYTAANPVFSDLWNNLTYKLQRALNYFFEIISFARICFFLWGMYLTGSILERVQNQYFSKKDMVQEDVLQRIRKRHKDIFGEPLKNLALKNANTIGVLSLTLLNGLLFVVNCIDIDFVWLHYSFDPNKPLYKLVHEGTEMLILSIFCAIAILLIFFKGNLNFYKKNKWLKYGAYAWIIQNSILVISVLLRDYYYIKYYGLAYKRIGVLVFLFMVLVGLITMFLKIYNRKSTYYLFRVNAWAGVCLLVIASCIHWDEMIARYNIRHAHEVTLDYAFLFSLSDKVLPTLEENRTTLFGNNPSDQGDWQGILRVRIRDFQTREQTYSWLSWNCSDAYVSNYLSKMNPAPVNR
ncbi:DUF4153 domain-containing protein [Taibaiella soli]|nr:DUF4173 domain-containing protein [Taibaiella soli]